MFLMIILGATHSKAPKGFAGLTIGLGLTLIHLISIPVTNTSVNPARSISQALFAQGWAIEQLIGFGRESAREVRKVVWPTRKEAMQMTGYVMAFVFVMALFMFLTDKTLEWVFYDLILGWR